MPRRKFAWEKLSDDELLKQRLSSLRVTVEGTWLEDCVRTLYEELEERGIRLRPHTWASSEWFSPGGVPGIAIPFYLTHPRLMKLERKMMFDVEGGTWRECMARPGMPCSMATNCSGAGAGSSCSARRRNIIRAITGPIRPAGVTSSTFGSGTHRAIRTKTSPKPLPYG